MVSGEPFKTYPFTIGYSLKGFVMDEKACLPFSQICFKNRFLYLFISLLAVLFLAPFIEGYPYLRILIGVFLSAVFLSAVYAISQKRHNTLIAVFLVLPTLTFTWASYFVDSLGFFLASRVSIVLFFAFIIVNILVFIFRQDEVTRDLIIGAAVVYLLLAEMWSYVYQILEKLRPGSFAVPDGPLQNSLLLFDYYSLVTITTLGYGDVTPLTSVASTLSTLEAVIGQLYLVITVAWLVGVHVSQSIQKKSR
jgi:hypothetical protein